MKAQDNHIYSAKTAAKTPRRAPPEIMRVGAAAELEEVLLLDEVEVPLAVPLAVPFVKVVVPLVELPFEWEPLLELVPVGEGVPEEAAKKLLLMQLLRHEA